MQNDFSKRFFYKKLEFRVQGGEIIVYDGNRRKIIQHPRMDEWIQSGYAKEILDEIIVGQ